MDVKLSKHQIILLLLLLAVFVVLAFWVGLKIAIIFIVAAGVPFEIIYLLIKYWNKK